MASGKSANYVFEDAALRLTEKAVAFIEQHRDEPFFLYLAHRNIHNPKKPNARFAGTSEIGVYGDFIHELDWSVGEVLAALEQLKLAENTLVFFSSDNGGVKAYERINHAEIEGHRINGPLRGQKTEVYEGGHRVPFLARWPGHVKAGSESRQLIALNDVLATCADLLRVPIPRDAAEDSFSFMPALLGKPEAKDLRQSLVNDSMMGWFSIREGQWKLIVGQDGGGFYSKQDPLPPAAESAGQLYNLDDDLGETKNLYNENPERVARLTALLAKLRNDGRSRP
jgi:arylsulfatase A-like enzyme